VAFAPLVVAAAVWFLLHAAVAGSPLRGWLVARLGDKGYRGAFSLASLASLWWLLHEYGRAPYSPVWLTPNALSFVPLLVVPVACVLLVGAFTVPNPTSVGGEKALGTDDAERGVLRITRHPFLWAVALWSATHALVNLDPGAWLFFGSLGLTALVGTRDIDRKRRRSNPSEYARFEARTSNLPFAAVARGRNRVVLRELALPLALGLALALTTIVLHPRLFGAQALPASMAP
jgi:uncharacterized membrane protein